VDFEPAGRGITRTECGGRMFIQSLLAGHPWIDFAVRFSVLASNLATNRCGLDFGPVHFFAVRRRN
jgi:hypothetical protein